jgi:hypothetical protein
VRIDGPAGRQASLLLEEAARDLQIQTVPPEAPCDFLILGDLSLRHTGCQTLHGNPPQNVFATRGRMKLDRSTENLLAFNSSGSKSVPDSATGAAQGDAQGNAQCDAQGDDKPWWKVW